ncbi:hypothetical protein T484DRAFT_2026374 [Baffinella frigidus]|nr:hypothetical protein T484DRAFT_2026374 [Cryptophyta sp. CCMP2293]
MPARDAAPTETAKFEVPRGVPLSRDLEGDASAPPAPGVADRSASQEHWRTAAAAVVPSAGNCRRYKNSYWIFDGPCSACGFAKNDTCHQIPHNCLVCGDTFTARTCAHGNRTQQPLMAPDRPLARPAIAREDGCAGACGWPLWKWANKAGGACVCTSLKSDRCDAAQVDNQESSCAVHPLPKLKIVGKTSHAVHKYKVAPPPPPPPPHPPTHTDAAQTP